MRNESRSVDCLTIEPHTFWYACFDSSPVSRYTPFLLLGGQDEARAALI